MADRLGLSRPTVRRAIQELVAQGLLLRRRGLGTPGRRRQDPPSRRADRTLMTTCGERVWYPAHRGAPHTRSSRTRPRRRRWGCPSHTPLLRLLRLRRDGRPPPRDPAETGCRRPSSTSPASSSRTTVSTPCCAPREASPSSPTSASALAPPSASERKHLVLTPPSQPVLTMTRVAFDAVGGAVEYGDHCYRAQDPTPSRSCSTNADSPPRRVPSGRCVSRSPGTVSTSTRAVRRGSEDLAAEVRAQRLGAPAPSRRPAGGSPGSPRSCGWWRSVPFSVASGAASRPSPSRIADAAAGGPGTRAVRGRGQLAVLALGRDPRLAVELAGGGGAQVAGGDVDHPEGQLDLASICFSQSSSRWCSASASSGVDVREHLDLVELVDADDAAGVLAVASRPRGGSRARSRRSAAAAGRRRGSRPCGTPASGTSEVPTR